MAAKHTNRPWRKIGHRQIATGEGAELKVICEVWSGGVGIEQADANEDVIAAAPDLLAAAQRVYREMATGDLTIGAMEDLGTAIDKATGVA